MSRLAPRLLILSLALSVAASGLLFGAKSGEASRGNASGGAPPNVVLFLTDDQRQPGTMHAMDATRRIFADRGVRYPNAYVTTNQCCPSRASILSGQYAHNHGVVANGHTESFDPTESWPRQLNQAGYRTAYFGKYFNRFDPRLDPPFFDRAFIGYDEDHADHARNQDAFATRKAIHFLEDVEQADDQAPWALVVSYHSPHTPFEMPKRFANRHVRPFDPPVSVRNTSLEGKNPAAAQAQAREGYHPARARAAQLRMLMSVDAGIKRIWEELARADERAQTLAMFSSDNGFFWGEHGFSHKYMPYIESHHVPMYVRYPVDQRPAETAGGDRRLVANIDLAPTILDVTGIAPDYTIDGVSLLDTAERSWLLFEGATRGTHDDWPAYHWAYFDGSRHYFKWRDGFEEFYDLERDPFEMDNLLTDGESGNDPSDLALLRTQAEQATTCAGAAECP